MEKRERPVGAKPLPVTERAAGQTARLHATPFEISSDASALRAASAEPGRDAPAS